MVLVSFSTEDQRARVRTTWTELNLAGRKFKPEDRCSISPAALTVLDKHLETSNWVLFFKQNTRSLVHKTQKRRGFQRRPYLMQHFLKPHPDFARVMGLLNKKLCKAKRKWSKARENSWKHVGRVRSQMGPDKPLSCKSWSNIWLNWQQISIAFKHQEMTETQNSNLRSSKMVY